MIVVFTGADELDEDDGKDTLEEFLSDCPESLKKWKKKVEEQKHDDEHLTRIFEMIWKLRLMNVEALKTTAKVWNS
ncbi:hypothetical protein L6452_25544 [Arctium lappa]|uniref:Uncharacterized protein n=1 Tax=Arctium lappa TaxID=4217 RepID=A0ACB9ABV9_ARCLA|nr:hypothetical protein L6452_25544 [Arctium lappa]